jgi:hypothetical protein
VRSADRVACACYLAVALLLVAADALLSLASSRRE